MHAIHSVACGPFPYLTTRAYGIRKLLEHLDGSVPIDACVGDTHTLFERGRSFGGNLLVALVDMRFYHYADYAILALAKLIANSLRNFGLVLVIFVRVP